MAKIVVNFDTNDKTLEVKVGGKVLDNISSVSFSKKMPYEMGGQVDSEDETEFSCYVSQMGYENDGMTQCQHTYANSNTEGLVPLKGDSNQISKDIAEYLKRLA